MLTDWLADKTGEERGGGGDREMERRELVVHRGNWEILLTSPLPPSPLHTSLSVNEFSHKPWRESDFTRSQES